MSVITKHEGLNLKPSVNANFIWQNGVSKINLIEMEDAKGNTK